MNHLLKLEQLALFGLSIFLFNQTEFAWWWYLVLILLPDISIVGYWGGSKAGAFLYNFFHHQAVALVVLFIGYQSGNDWVYLSGIILFGHSSMDRIFGYGLKYEDAFKHTHLGWIGK